MVKKIQSEMAGTILEIKVQEGQNISAGEEIAVVESMKMEVSCTSSYSGKILSIKKKGGDFINEGEVLMEIETT